MALASIREIYKGYEIRKFSGTFGGYTDYFYIAKNGERVSQLCLCSPQAAKNVINTHLENQHIEQLFQNKKEPV